MLRHRLRFHSRGGVNYVRQKGTVIRNTYFTLIFMPNDHKCRRFAVIVSKKIIKTAVARNRARRRVYEALRLENVHTLPPIDCLFIIHNPKVLSLDFIKLRHVIRDLLTDTQAQG